MDSAHRVSRHERVGLLSAALCALLGACVPAVAKLTTAAAPPIFVATASTCLAGVAAATWLLLRGRLQELFQRRHFPAYLLVAGLGTALSLGLFFTGASQATAIETVLCLQTEPAYSLVLAWLFLGHRPTPRRVAATLLLLTGITLAIGPAGLRASPGIWILLATPLCWQASHMVALRALRGTTAELLTGARYVLGAGILALGWMASGGLATAPSLATWLPILPLLALQGVILGYAGTFLWYAAVLNLDLTRATAIVVPSTPLLSLVASFLLLGEIPTFLQMLGMLLTVIGVAAFATAPRLEAMTKPPLSEEPAPSGAS